MLRLFYAHRMIGKPALNLYDILSRVLQVNLRIYEFCIDFSGGKVFIGNFIGINKGVILL